MSYCVDSLSGGVVLIVSSVGGMTRACIGLPSLGSSYGKGLASGRRDGLGDGTGVAYQWRRLCAIKRL